MEYLLRIAVSFWSVLGQMSPYLLFGFLVAGVLSVLVSPAFVERHLGRGRYGPVLKASAFGVPLPLCSCGVIPVSASLRRHGASRGAATAFLISTPQTGVDGILVTLALLGPVYAIVRPVLSLIAGIAGGLAATVAADEPAAASEGQAETCQDACCTAESGGKIRRILSYGFDALPRDIGRSLLVGLVLAALITALLPKDFLGGILGTTGGPSLLRELGIMLLMVVVGIPVYVCATASVPVVAALIFGGLSPGAGLVFLMTGPATNAATIAVIWRVMGKRTAIVYLTTVIVFAVGGGVAMDYLFHYANVPVVSTGHEMLPPLLKNIAAVVLLGILAAAILRPKLTRDPLAEEVASEGEQAMTFHVSGMTCGHCAESVRQALAAQPGVREAHVDHERGRALVRGAPLDPVGLSGAVHEAGYQAELAEEDRPGEKE